MRFYRIPTIVALDNGSLVSVADEHISCIREMRRMCTLLRSTDKGVAWSCPQQVVTRLDPDVIDGYRICHTRIPASEIAGLRKAAH